MPALQEATFYRLLMNEIIRKALNGIIVSDYRNSMASLIRKDNDELLESMKQRDKTMDAVKKITLKYTIVQIFFEGCAAIVYGYGLYMLMQRGFNSAVAGLCMALANVLSLIIQPIVSNYLDNTKKMNIFTMSILCYGIIFAVSLANCFIHEASLTLAVVFIMFCGIYSSTESLVNSFAAKFSENRISIGFSTPRAIGSLSYGITCALLGVISEQESYMTVLIAAVVFVLATTLSIIVLNRDFDATKPRIEEQKKSVQSVSMTEFAKTNRNYLILILFLACLFYGYTCLDNFLLLIAQDIGGSSADMGKILGVKAAVETVMIFLFPLIRKKLKIETILSVAAICFAIKEILISVSTTVAGIYLTQLIQGVSFAWMLPGMVELANQRMRENEIARGQALFTMAIVLGSTFSSIFGGSISQAYGIKWMENVAIALAIVGAVGFVIFVHKKDAK